MVLNYIWIAFFIIAFVIALVKLVFWGDFEVFPAMMDSTFSTSKTAFEISLGLTGVLSLWLGIMKIGEKGGVVNVLARILSPIFVKLFPDIPKGHPVTGSIFMNIAANMLGLDNAATPLGLKAMEHVPCAEYQRADADSYLHHGLSCPDGCSTAYGYLHPHPVGHFLLDTGRYHHHLTLPEDQSAEPHCAADIRRCCSCSGNHHLGLWTDGLYPDEQGQHLFGQYSTDADYHRLHPRWCEEEGQCI